MTGSVYSQGAPSVPFPTDKDSPLPCRHSEPHPLAREPGQEHSGREGRAALKVPCLLSMHGVAPAHSGHPIPLPLQAWALWSLAFSLLH